MNKYPYHFLTSILAITLMVVTYPSFAQDERTEITSVIITDLSEADDSEVELPMILDDKKLLDAYTQRYQNLTKEILLEMVKDETLSPYKAAATVRVFAETYAFEVVSREKKIMEKILLRRLNRDESPLVQVEIMHALLRLDRYRYFASMVPALIQKMNHYNEAVNNLAFEYLEAVVQSGNGRTREARIVFNTLRKVLFLSRRKLADNIESDPRLKQKLKLLRWSIKVLGTQELKRLPKEVINHL